MATPSSAWTGEKPRKRGNGAGRGSAARSGEKVVPISPTGSAQDVHRTPPHSVEAEQGVLGSMLISPRETIAECVEKITREYFYVPAHRTIYDILVELWNAGQAIDLITFTQVLRDRNLLDSVGGAALVTICSRSFRPRPTCDTIWRSFATNTFCDRSFPPPPRASAARTKSRTRSTACWTKWNRRFSTSAKIGSKARCFR